MFQVYLSTMGVVLVFPCLVWGAVLENPAPSSFQSGIGVLSGWKCTVGTIIAQFDGGPSV